MSYTRMCLDSCGSLCVQIGWAESPQWPPKKRWLCMGKQNMLAYLPNQLTVSLQFFCNDVCFLLGLYNTKNNVIWWCGWPAKILWWKIGFTPQAIRHFCQYLQHSSSGAISSYLWELSLIVASLGHHTQFTFQKYPLWGPPSTPSGKMAFLPLPFDINVQLKNLPECLKTLFEVSSPPMSIFAA
jgi:hypothetical protein